MDAMNVQKLHRVTVLYADSDSELCHAVQLYADGRQEIEACAIAPDGWKVLQLLEEGFRPQVIVLDSLVSGPTLSHILTRICLLGEQRPYVILTGVPGMQAILQRFLTMGANYIIFKPYTLDDLFAEIYHFCVDDLQWDIYRAKARFFAAFAPNAIQLPSERTGLSGAVCPSAGVRPAGLYGERTVPSGC